MWRALVRNACWAARTMVRYESGLVTPGAG
jgi:hypothetical protein